MAVEPVPAATILMLRDGTRGLEVFMVERHHKIDFATGALVFPGGKVDAGDADARVLDRCDGLDADVYRASIQVAAIREAFEECGILLARADASKELVDGDRLTSLDAFRTRLNNGELSLAEFLESQSLRLACDLLVHYAHWITPDMMPKRFDTHFYLARAPQDHLAAHDGYESVDSVWTTPGAAMEAADNGTRTIIFPTLLNIAKLARFATTAEALERTGESTVVEVLPWTERRDDGNYICIPPEAGYDISEQKTPDRA